MFFHLPDITQLRKLQSLDLNSHLTDSKTYVPNLYTSLFQLWWKYRLRVTLILWLHRFF